MDRGPVALFGAIVAVGLGPAMWLGAQFGSIEVAPSRPQTVVGEPNSVPDRLVGGTGAGDTAGDDSVINATPQSEIEPTTRRSSPSPSATSSAPISPTPSRSSASPSPSRTTATSEPTTPPTESTTTPTTPATEGTSSPVPPGTTGDGAVPEKSIES